MATLSGNKIKNTYQSLVKFSDNGNITTSAKQLTDGFGNNSPMFVSTTQVGIGVTPESGLNLHVFGDAKIGSNLTVIGNLVVEGSTTTVGTDTLTVKDPLIVLANNNTSTDAVDIGFYGKYHPSDTTLYSGLFREALTGKYRLFKGLEVEPTTTVNTSGTGYAVATLIASLEGNVTGNLLGNVSGTLTGNVIGGSISGTTGDFSGNVDIDGTLDVDDVISIEGSAFGRIEIGGSSGGYIDLKAPASDDYDLRIITSSGGNEITTATGDLIFNTAETLALTIDTSQNATFAGNVSLPDNGKAIFGTGGDGLEIYHDGTESYIKDTGTGNLVIQASDKIEFKGINGNNLLRANEGGDVSLWYNNAEKLATTSTGINVIGTVDGRDISVDGAKLDGIEAGADVTDATNVLAAGAVMTTGNQSIAGEKTFSDQVTIPATPSASTDAASKGYVDGLVEGQDTLAEILAIGNTTEGTDIAITAGDKITNFTSTGIDDNSTSTVLTIDNTNRALFSGDVSIQGNLIGNTNATGDLTILGNLFVGDYGVNDDPDYLYADNNIFRIGYYSNAKTFEVNETDFKVSSNHKIGIGTNDPQTLLEVSNENSGLIPIIRLNNVDSSLSDGQNLGSIEFYNDHTNLTTGNIGMFYSTDGTIAKEMRFNFGSPYGDIFKINVNEITAAKKITVTGTGTVPSLVLNNTFSDGGDVGGTSWSLNSTNDGDFTIKTGSDNIANLSNVSDTTFSPYRDFIVNLNDNKSLILLSGTDETAYIEFSDVSSGALKNFISLDHNTDLFNINSWGTFKVAIGEGVQKLTVDGTNVSVHDDLIVDGNSTFAGDLQLGGTTPTLNFYKTSNADILANIKVETDAGSGGKLTIQTKRNGNTAIDALVIDDNQNATFAGIITANSSSSGDYVRMYGSSGTGKWDIYGNGANLRITDNESAGILAVDTGATFGGKIESVNELVNINSANGLRSAGLESDSTGNIWLGTGTTAATINFVTGNSTNGNPSVNGVKRLTTNREGTDVYASYAGSTFPFRVGYLSGSTYIPTLTVADTGRVFIGVSSGTTIQDSTLQLQANGASQNAGLMFVNKGNTASYNDIAGIASFVESGSAKGNLQFWTRNSDGDNSDVAPRMTINSSGNVGIGTDSPQGKLNVTIGVGTNGAELQRWHYSTTPDRWNLRLTQVVSGNDVAWDFKQTNNNTDYGSVLTLKNGNVGIGTDSPQAQFCLNNQIANSGTPLNYSTVQQNVLNGYYTTGESPNRYTRYFDIACVGDGDGTNGGGNIRFLTNPIANDTATEKMRITSGGAVEIASISGSSVIDYGMTLAPASGYAQIYLRANTTSTRYLQRFYNESSGVLQNVGNITISGSSTNYVTSSDYRLKEDLQDFAGLDMVSKIPVYDFKWKTDESRSYGVMAHELQEVLPDAVSGNKDAINEDESINPQGVDYSKIVPLLVKSIQELKAEVDKLKQECKCKN